jgi:hypothetical protein
MSAKLVRGACLAAIALGVLLGLLIYGSRRTVPPSETPPGAAPQFDRLLEEADAGGRFLFATERTLIETDIHGQGENLLLDLVPLTGVPDAHFVGSWVRLSPDRRRVLVPYLVGQMEPSHNRRLLVYDLESRSSMEVPIPRIRGRPDDQRGPQAEYGFDMDLVRWLSPTSFLIRLTYYPPEGAHLYTEKYLHFNAEDPAQYREIDLGVERPVFRVSHGTFVLLFVSGTVRRSDWVVQALDQSGVRPATPGEVETFHRLYREELYADEEPRGPGSPEVRPVPLGILSQLDDKRFDENRGRSDLFFSGRWVRRTGRTFDSVKLRWQPDLSLYVWDEYTSSSTTFLANAEGHYRGWHQGTYIGKIPK